MELKSKLDKYQSIFPSSPPSSGGASDATTRTSGARKVNRAVGISAEPQSLKNLQELTTAKFPEFKKEKK